MKKILGLTGALGMMILILDGKTALTGAGEGLALCIRTVIPSLLPFFVLTPLASTLGGNYLSVPARFLGIPEGAEGILVPAFLGGYPMGARCIGENRDVLDPGDARRLLAFCNQAGPAFLFGVLGPMFPEKWMLWSLWAIQIGSAVLVATVLPGTPGTAAIPHQAPSLPRAMEGAVKAMGLVCGWVIFFRVVLAFLDRWVLWLLPLPGKILVTGMLELTNGCCLLPMVADLRLRYLLAAGMLSGGGLCVALQTGSVAGGLGAYFPGKILQTFFALGLALGVVRGYGAVLIPGILLFCIFCRRIRKNSGKTVPSGV